MLFDSVRFVVRRIPVILLVLLVWYGFNWLADLGGL